MRCAAALFAVLLVVSAGVLPARADDTARQFVESIYQHYVGEDAPGVGLEDSEALLEYFTPELAAMIAADRAQARQDDGAVQQLDGDPFVEAQDWDIQDVSIKVQERGADAAVAVASFINSGVPVTVELHLKKTAAGWRVDDIIWSEGMLRGLFEDDGGADDGGADDNPLPDTQQL